MIRKSYHKDILKTASMLSINDLEKEMIKEDQVPCPVVHRFSPGIYIREVFIPADTFAIGHRQKTEHLNIFLKGKVTMLNDDGSVTYLEAPMIFTGQPGRKCGYISEDMVWLNVYNTDETDIEKLEDTFLDKSPLIAENIKHVSKVIDNDDYKKVLEEFGFDEETARSQSENKEDQIPFPPGGYSVIVSDSDIEGKGLFATASFDPGQQIAPARIKDKRTPAGVYTNHSISPNAIMERVGDDILLTAKKSINGCSGGFNGDEITIDYRQALTLQIGGKKCQQ